MPDTNKDIADEAMEAAEAAEEVQEAPEPQEAEAPEGSIQEAADAPGQPEAEAPSEVAESASDAAADVEAPADADPAAGEAPSEPEPAHDPEQDYVVDEAAEAAEDMPFDPDGAFSSDSDRDEFLRGSSDDWVDDDQTDYYRYGDKMHNVRDQVVNTDVASGGLGRHGRPKAGSLQPLNEHQRRSRRMRRVLTVVAILLVALLAALAYFGYQLLRESSSATQPTTAPAATEVGEAARQEEAAKEVETAEKKTSAPKLVPLINKTPEAALDVLGESAIVTLDAAVDEEGNPVKRRQSIVLTSEPVDSKSGTPTVYLGMDASGNVIQAGYSAATASLGYGTMSFADAVTTGHIIEETLREAGLDVADGEVKLPDSSQYSTYAEDGTTWVKEQCTFEGSIVQDGLDCDWSAVLLYNYTAANTSGNLADTVRTVFVYIDLAQPEGAAATAAASSALAAASSAPAAASSATAAASSAPAPATSQPAPAAS